MRNKERIPIFLKLIEVEEIAEDWNFPLHDIEPHHYLKWYIEYPDMRFGQFLINEGVAADNVKLWNMEESDFLDKQGVDPALYTLWGHIGNSKEESDRLIKEWQESYGKFGLNDSDLGQCSKFVRERIEAMDEGRNLSSISKDNQRKLTAFYAWNQSAPKPIYSPVRSLSTEHIKAVLALPKIDENIRKVMVNELEKRDDT